MSSTAPIAPRSSAASTQHCAFRRSSSATDGHSPSRTRSSGTSAKARSSFPTTDTNARRFCSGCSSQALVLVRDRIRDAYWWAVAIPPAWALGWLVTSYVITTNVKEQFAVFGGSGALVFGLLTWVLLAFLLGRPAPDSRRAPVSSVG